MKRRETGMMLIPAGLPEKAAAREIMQSNGLSARYGLVITQAGAAALIQARSRALAQSGRVEFGGGAIRAIITAFCDSPYITQDDYADTLCALAEIFYAFKTDSLDETDDAEAIAMMRRVFDERGGDINMVENDMEAFARNVRYERLPEDGGEPEDTEEDEADE